MKIYRIFKTAYTLGFFGLVLFSILNCAIQTPQAPGESTLGSNSLHLLPTVIAQACSECHESDRKDPGHYPGQDCKGCHNPELGWKNAKTFDHSFPSVVAQSCTTCHESDRKDAGHYPGQDCKGCHTAGGIWSNATNFNHQPTPNQCASCHADGQGQDSFPPGHTATGANDCISCHQSSISNNFSNWQGGTFNHSSSLIAQKNCISCHSSDRPSTGSFMAQDPALNTSDSHYGKFDCFFCHGTNNNFKDWNNTGDSHKNAQGSKIESCLPCHYARVRPQANQTGSGRIGEHSGQTSWFQPPIYDIDAVGNQPGANGKLGRCFDCHDRGRRSFAE